MNNNLFNRLHAARNITVNTDPYFNRVNALNDQKPYIIAKRNKVTKHVTIAAVIAGVFAFTMGTSLHENAPILGNILFLGLLTVIVIAGIAIRKARYAKFDAQIKSLDNEIAGIYEETNRIFEANAASIGFLPYEYRYTEAVDFMINMVGTERAINLPQALQLFDDYDHRRTLENQNQEILMQQQYQNAQLQSLNRTAKVNTGVNIAGTLFNIASKL